jgi:hypothetical protein
MEPYAFCKLEARAHVILTPLKGKANERKADERKAINAGLLKLMPTLTLIRSSISR